MKGNVTFDQVNLVSRITGEGVGRSFEGRGGLVLIKSERVWYIYIYDYSFFPVNRDLARYFFRLGLTQYGILETGISPSNRFVRGPAPTPLALPYLFRTSM